jgi:pilus assembly protein CpaF
MLGFKDPTRVIDVVDDASSLVEAKAAERDRASKSIDLKLEARQRVAAQLQPDASDVSASDLERASQEVRAKVEMIAALEVEKLQRRGAAGHGPVISDALAHELVQHVLDWQFGAGPLEPLFREPDVEDIVINSADATGQPALEVWTYRQGGKRREDIALTLDDLREVINRNAGYGGRALNPTTPILNAQMRNGARICAVLDPVCDPHISVTIRIHRLVARTFDDLVRLGTLSPAAASWLWLLVQSGLSIIVGGGTSSGKTNLLNALVGVMPRNLRCVVIEDTRELELPAPDKVYLVTVQNTDGTRAITQRQLVANALRMRPDRLILGEVRDAAAWDAVKACNTGHDGTLLSIHADDANGVLIRLSQLCGEAPETGNISEKMLREVIASAFQCVIFLERRRQPDGAFRRFVTQITEVNGFVSDNVTVQKPLFRFEQGELRWTQQWPHERIKGRIHDAGFSDDDIHAALTGCARLWEMPL